MHVCVTLVCSPPAALTFLAGYSQCLYCVCVMQSDTSTAALDCPPPSAESSAAGRSVPPSLHISPTVHPSFCLLSVGPAVPAPRRLPPTCRPSRARRNTRVRLMSGCLYGIAVICTNSYFVVIETKRPGKVLKCTPPLDWWTLGGPPVNRSPPALPHTLNISGPVVSRWLTPLHILKLND